VTSIRPSKQRKGKSYGPDHAERAAAILASVARRNQTDRFSLAIDAIDRMPRFRVTGSSARQALLKQQIACKNHTWEFGVDAPDIANWQSPF
jgi:phosphoketolase